MKNKLSGLKMMTILFTLTTFMLLSLSTESIYSQKNQKSQKNIVTIDGVEFENYVLLGKILRRRSEDISASRWALQGASAQEDILEILAESGVKWTRIGAGSYIVESGSLYNWEELDQLINGLLKRKINIFLTIQGIRSRDRSNTDMPQPEVLNLWEKDVEALIKHCSDRVHYFEIMNEPNQGGMPPQIYFEYVKRASNIIRKVDPTAKVIGGALARVDVPYLETLYELGIAHYIDILTFHPYSEFPESTAIKLLFQVHRPIAYLPTDYLVSDLKEVISQATNKITLWQGECGYPSGANSGGWQGKGPWGELIQGKWLLRRLLIDFSTGCEVSTIFVLREFAQDNRPNTKGLLRNDNITPKPAYYSLSNFTSIFDDRFNELKSPITEFNILKQGTFYGASGSYPPEQLSNEMRMPLPIQVVSPGGKEGDIVTYWLPWRMQELVNPATISLKLTGTNIINPILVNLLDGQVYQVPFIVGEEGTLFFPNLPLTDYPFAIISKKQMKISIDKPN